MTDPIADMLTRIRNALIAGIGSVEMPASKMKVELAKILKDEGYISDYKSFERRKFKFIKIDIGKTEDGAFIISEIKRASKPGRRIYVKRHDIPRVKGGLGVTILSTSKGVMTGLNARKIGIGGELLATVW